MAKAIGPSFPSELQAAGLSGLPFSWGPDGVIQFNARMTPAQITAVQAVYAVHDPTRPAPPPSPSELAVALDAYLNTPLPTPAQLKAILQAWRQQVS